MIASTRALMADADGAHGHAVAAGRKRTRSLDRQIVDADAELGIGQGARTGGFLPRGFRLGATRLQHRCALDRLMHGRIERQRGGALRARR